MVADKVIRRLATVLFADVANYSALMGRDEAGTLAALKGHREQRIDPAIARHQGRLVGTAGDSLLVEFSSVVAAVSCATEVQAQIAAHNADVPAAARMAFRIGINLAEVIVEGDEIYGDGVNVAARLEAVAEPGGICASRAVVEQLGNRLPLGFENLGPIKVKNIAEPVHAFRIRGADGGQAPAEATVPASAARPPRPEEARGSIAVFPFSSLSPDPADAYLADGIAAEIVAMLARMPDLRVVSRQAMAAYRGRESEARALVDDLQIRYVLTGSVRHAGDRIRVTAELSEAADFTQLWSRTYERELADIFAVQEEIAEAIVIAFGGEYLRAEWRRARRRPTDNLDAWGLVQKARSLNLPVNRTAADEALRLAREAVALDPGYAGAHACLASTLMQRVLNGFAADSAAERAEAVAAVERAADLSPDDPMVLRALGNVFSNCGEHDKAVRMLRRAVQIAPFDFQCWGRLGRTLAYGGSDDELREGHAILDRIMAAAPNHPMQSYWLYFKAVACMREGRNAEAADYAERSVEAQPAYAGAWLTLADALGRLGRVDAAREAMARAQRANPAMTPAHLAEQIRILAADRPESAGETLAGLRAAGLL